MTTCDRNSANQNITAYGVLLFVSNLLNSNHKYDDGFTPLSPSASMGLCIFSNFGLQSLVPSFDYYSDAFIKDPYFISYQEFTL